MATYNFKVIHTDGTVVDYDKNFTSHNAMVEYVNTALEKPNIESYKVAQKVTSNKLKKSFLIFSEKWLKNRKTPIVNVYSSTQDNLLGQIKFYGAWRCWTFYPNENTIFDHKCLHEIQEELDRRNKEIRHEWAEHRKEVQRYGKKN